MKRPIQPRGQSRFRRTIRQERQPVINIAPATKLSGRTAGCWRASRPPTANRSSGSTGSSPPETTRRPATRTGTHHDGHFRLVQSPHHHKRHEHNRRGAPEGSTQTCRQQQAHVLTSSSARTRCLQSFAPVVTARPPFCRPVPTSRGLHASHQPTEGPPELSTTCLQCFGLREVNTTS